MAGLAQTRRRWILGGAAVVLIGGGFLLWRHLFPRESTDDAQVSGHVTPISARVAGPVIAVHVVDNQAVKAGEVLVEIDPRDYQLALERAKADLAAAEAGAAAARTEVPIMSTTSGSQVDVAHAATGSAAAAANAAMREVEAAKAKRQAAQARLAEVTATATRASQDLERLKPLIEKDEISRQQYDAAVSGQQAAQATVESARAAISEADANIAVAEARREQATGALAQARAQAQAASTAPQQVAMTKARADTADARVLQAGAAVNEATLALERTSIRAPVAGIVSRKTVEVGQLIQVGQPLLALTSLDDIWVTAHFKETQLDGMHAGQRAEIDVDTYDHAYTGHVDSIAAATGATFSLLPPDNASGNFVKVVQRVPVKIAIDHGQNEADLLRPGMSATVTVFIK